eukprot:TRINITY_DN5660_c0_g1_i1.p1 TRINITY_DN5660_c0_g1~~TRINITY_DN5660_c0_g1_i1.p1  ORF type:complete len:183 (+),score=33.19 TRINITY_DN5660_c0_g1_i1:361-909(+)
MNSVVNEVAAGRGDEEEVFNMNDRIFQVFFLPSNIEKEGSSYVIAFCPFTSIMATGNSEQEAASNWLDEAKRTLKLQIRFPPFVPTMRKVWYTETQLSSLTSTPVFMIDHYEYNAENQGEKDQDNDKVVVIYPKVKKILNGTKKELAAKGELSGLWFDQKVSCTPLLIRDTRFTMTPQYINA